MGDSNPDRDAYSDKDFDDIPDSYEGLQMNYDREAFESSDSSRQADAGSSSTMVQVPVVCTLSILRLEYYYIERVHSYNHLPVYIKESIDRNSDACGSMHVVIRG